MTSSNKSFSPHLDNLLETKCQAQDLQEVRELEMFLGDDLDSTFDNIRRLKTRRELQCVESQLEDTKKDITSRMKQYDEHIKVYELNQGKMKDQIQKFAAFIQENDMKTLRAESLEKNETREYDQSIEKVKELKNHLIEKESELEDLVIKLQRYKVYDELMIKVITEAKEFDTIESILGRYKTLKDTNKSLCKTQLSLEKGIERTREGLNEVNETKNKMISKDAILYSYQKRSDEVREAQIKRNNMEKNERRRSDGVLELSSKIIMSIKNLQTKCCNSTTIKRRKIINETISNLSELSRSLDLVADQVLDWGDIVRNYNKDLKR